MRGYKGLPKATAETVHANQLHTGDLGTVDALGYLRITGRKKDLIITAGGENVAPTPIEDALKTLIPRAGHVVLVGDRRKFLTALVAPAEDAATPPAEEDLKKALEASVRRRRNLRLEAYLIFAAFKYGRRCGRLHADERRLFLRADERRLFAGTTAPTRSRARRRSRSSACWTSPSPSTAAS